MKIAKQMPKFKRLSLIISSSRQNAEIYLASQDEIEIIDLISIANPKYSDREGLFGNAGPGTKVGGVYESKKNYVVDKYLRLLADKVFKIGQAYGYKDIYLFCPEYMEASIRSAFHKSDSKKIIMTLNGNFINDHPFNLLRLIREEQKREKSAKESHPIPESSLKLLSRSSPT